MAVSLITVPLAVGYLGNERYGLWMTAVSITSFVSFLDFGLAPVLLNRMAESFAAQDKSRFQNYCSAGILLGGCIFLLGCILSVIAYFVDWVSLLSLKDPLLKKEIGCLVSSLMLISFGALSLSIVDNIYAARLQLTKPRVYASAAALAGLGLLFAGIKIKVGLPLLAAISLSPLFLYRLVLLLELSLYERNLFSISLRTLPRLLRELVPISILFMGIQFFAVLFSSVPNIFLAKYAGLNAVASFSVAFKLYQIPLLLLAGLLPVFWPAFTIAWENRDIARLRRWLLLACLVTFLTTSLFVAVAVLWGKEIIYLWTRGNVETTASLLMVLGVWMVCQSVVHWLSTFLHAITDFRFEFICYGISALLLICVGAWAAVHFSASGIAATMGLALTLGCLCPMIWRCSGKLKMTYV